jgi:hypothetical protein
MTIAGSALSDTGTGAETWRTTIFAAGKLRLDGHAQGSFFERSEQLRLFHALIITRGLIRGYWEGLQFKARGKY